MLAAAATATAAPGKGLTIDDMLAMQRVGAPVVSPDGKRVVFAVRDTDFDANKGRFDLWMANIDGSGLVHLTTDPDNETDPQWTRDGAWIYFLSNRSGSSQVWRISPSGGEGEQVTHLPVDLNGFTLFPDGKHLALAADVWPDAKSLAESAKRDRHESKSKVKAQVYDQLLFRHWDQWEDGKYSHVLAWTPPELGGKADDAKDLTPGQLTDTPTHPFGDMSQVQVSPDGKWIAFVARVGGREMAWTTNTDVFLVPSNGSAKPIDLTTANKAYDDNPRFSPDGKSLAFTMMKRAGFEADRTRIAVIDLTSHAVRVVTEAWDRSAGELVWAPDGKTIFTSADNVGQHSIFAIEVASGNARVVVDKGTNESPALAGDRLVFAHDTLKLPTELFTAKLDGSDLRQITHFNDARVKAIAWGDYEQFTFKGAKGDTVYGYAIKPAGFVNGTKYPIAFLIHGGPQGSFGDHFHYRWNPEAFAGHGYGVVMIDFHGSTGYGQAFTDAISGDWGGAPYDDLMMGLDAAIAKYSWLDGARAAALGASFGGYMINWINGKTDRFKALVVHDGNNDERAAYLMTEELWFPEWEHGGVPWEKPEGYAKHEPFDLIKNWKTPTLVVHGGLDFRIPDTAGMATFTALQRKGVPSRFLYFPDENHWVVKPQNSKLWHDEVFAWIDKYTKRR
ncbi:MAG TPA: S9 family peptidase [Kofleriaceae bacterium]|jgi:dipeptidyl aminopeptidase/acylaminoacyl peptidase|nr:S9 family peptidase [Kofleriaceae bacterium]